MKYLPLLLISLFAAIFLNASEPVGIQVDNQGLVTNIIPFYKSPCLDDEDSPKDVPGHENTTAASFSKTIVDLKKCPTALDNELKRLESLPPMNIPIKSAPLHAAIRLCAEAANMNFVAPPAQAFNDTVTLKVHANPYEILNMLSDHHGLGMEYERGMWHFYRVNHNELITRKYKLKYNNQEIVNKSPPSLNKTIDSSLKAQNPYGSSNGGGVFSVDTEAIVRDIQKMLKLPTTGLAAVIENGGSVGDFGPMSKPSINGVGQGTLAPSGEVLYVSDTNELLIVATRQQHSYIESYLETVDKPQRLISIAAEFVETSRDPKSEMGIDWSGVSGAKVSLNNVAGDLNKGSWPNTAILSASEMALQFNLIKTDSQSRIVQNPQVVTTNNRKVALRSVVQQPIESANNNQITSGTTNNTSTIDYLEIGTIIDVFPQIMEGSIAGFDGESVQLNISIVVSSIVGEKIIRGNPFPVVSSRTYDYSVIVPSGYTLAIGGLSESNYTTSETKVPLLGDIPLLGNLFKSNKEHHSRRNLIAYITPEILTNEHLKCE